MCWDNCLRESGGAGCSQTYGKDPFASACVWTHISPLCLCCPWLRNLLFSFSSSLFDFLELVIPGPGLSKRLRAIKYSSALINCSPSPFGGGRGGEKNDIELFRAQSGLFLATASIQMRWCAAGSSVCVFWCGGSVNSMSILCCHNYRHYAGVIKCLLFSWLQFPIIAARLKDFNRSTKSLYYVMQGDPPPLSCTDKKCECPYRRNRHKLRLSYTPSLMSIPFRPNIRPEWSWSNHAWSSKMSDFI